MPPSVQVKYLWELVLKKEENFNKIIGLGGNSINNIKHALDIYGYPMHSDDVSNELYQGLNTNLTNIMSNCEKIIAKRNIYQEKIDYYTKLRQEEDKKLEEE